MLKKDRYRLVYRIVKNEYQDTKLAKRSQTWSDERLRSELGINVDAVKKEPTLQKINTTRQKSYYARKRERLEYGKSQGLTAEESLSVSNLTEDNIDREAEYYEVKKRQKTTRQKKLKKLHERMDKWSEWSKAGMPPFIKRLARRINKGVATPEGRAKFDSNAKYGYAYAYYMFVEERDEEEISDLVQANIHDEYALFYPKEVTAV